jgi:uncharacterized protein YozE (UPF0346 family)
MSNRFFKPLRYSLMRENNKIGDVIINLERDGNYTFEVDLLPNVDTKELPWALKDRSGKFITKERNPKLHNRLIKNWLEERVFPKERHDADEILNHFNMTEYDLVSILKRTNARNRYDNYWIRFNPNTHYKPSTFKKRGSM